MQFNDFDSNSIKSIQILSIVIDLINYDEFNQFQEHRGIGFWIDF